VSTTLSYATPRRIRRESRNTCRVADVDWESDHGRYRIRIDVGWVVVPEGAVITQPNKTERAMVWKHYIDGYPRVRCFMPGIMM
jgi:hypothetical protein